MGQAVARVIEDLRVRFNAAGGDIGKLDGGYLPQAHDARALLRCRLRRVADYILPRLDLDAHGGPADRRPADPGPAGRRACASPSTGSPPADGPTASRRPQPFGRRALANQRAEHRFLHFKIADDWLAYDREFGGDPFKAIFNHINGMARDIAVDGGARAEPAAHDGTAKQVVASEVAKAVDRQAGALLRAR